MRKGYIAAGLVAATLAISSCSTPKDITYFQDMTPGTVVAPLQVNEIKIKPEDKLSIVVTTQDGALSSLFNLVSTQNRIASTTSAVQSSSGGGGGNMASGTAQIAYYTVNHSGDINFPVIGKLHIAGMTRFQIAAYIEKELQERDLVKDPIVTVEYVNTGLSVLGEVKTPGRYEFNKDRLTIVDAIAMAGDLTMNGMRENVLVLRQTPDGAQEAYRINLTDYKDLAQSPVYYLQQDDVIYVEPNDKAKRETTATGNTPLTPSFWITAGSLAVTIATLVVTLSR